MRAVVVTVRWVRTAVVGGKKRSEVYDLPPIRFMRTTAEDEGLGVIYRSSPHL
jgi:hypothetical protein